MKHFLFASGNRFDLEMFDNLTNLVDEHPDFQTVFLNSFEELELLLRKLGANASKLIDLNTSDFVCVIDLSEFFFPEYTQEEYDRFYTDWMESTDRKNNMDEYGQFIFLQGLSRSWNMRKFRFVLIVK